MFLAEQEIPFFCEKNFIQTKLYLNFMAINLRQKSF